jgi:pyruvate dehydrogenase E2 component (dihydrolipoamide acetyltransferase)
MAAVKEVLVPDIGEFKDIPVIEIIVSPGDAVAIDDALLTLESDKATMDIPAPFAGVVTELLVVVGDRVSEGTRLLTLTVDEEAETPLESAEAASDAAVPPVAADASASANDLTSVEASGDATLAATGPVADSQALYASPSVRRLAREANIDLTHVSGSGRGGRILPEDVEGYNASHPTTTSDRTLLVSADSGVSLAVAPLPDVDHAKFGPVEAVELGRVKRIAGPYLHRNWVTIPHVTHHDEADITELEAFRVQSNQMLAAEGIKLTMVALLLKACAATLREFPDFNASLVGERLILKRYYHLGFAADTPQGLLVPVIRDVERKGLAEIASELSRLSSRAREGKLTSEEMQGGTFTISSLGGIGGTAFTPIVNAPEVAILGVTRAAFKPVWDGTQFNPRLMLGLSLSYDHRVIDGAAAARFTVHLAETLTDMRRVLL